MDVFRQGSVVAINRKNIGSVLLLLSPLVIYWGFNYDNVSLKFNWFLAVLTLPYIVQFSAKKGGLRFGLLSLFCGLLLLVFRSNSLFYFSAVFLLLYIFDNLWGRINNLPAILFLAISPVASVIVYIWSFPIRLKLSEWAASILSTMGVDISVSGNILTMEGNTFSVDPACIGLKMVVSSLVLGVLILAYFEKKYQTKISYTSATLMLLVVLFAAIFSNFTRLLALIIFHILPENMLHEAIGIFSLILYVIIPFYFFAGYVFKRKWNDKQKPKKVHPIQSSISKQSKAGIAILLLLLTINGTAFLEEKVEQFDSASQISLLGFDKTTTERGMLKFQNKAALIYIKAPVKFFQGSHDPRYCWQGSGYEFSDIQVEQIGELECYTAILRKGTDLLYTAWWYQNGTQRTVYEDWRWDSLKGRGGFSLVNVSCESRSDLEKSIELNILGL